MLAKTAIVLGSAGAIATKELCQVVPDAQWLRLAGDAGSTAMVLFIVWYLMTKWGPQNQTSFQEALKAQRADFLSELRDKRADYRNDIAAIRAEQKAEMAAIVEAFKENTAATRALTQRIDTLVDHRGHKP